MITQQEAEVFLEPYFVRLRKCIREAWARWERFCEQCPEFRKPLSARARAIFLYDHIVELAEAEFLADRPKVFVQHTRGFLELDIDDKVIIRFKKLNKKYKASNIPTHQQLLYSIQPGLFGSGVEASRLICGYQLTVIQSEIKDIAITCPQGQTVAWFFSIADRGDEASGDSNIRITPASPQDGATDTQFKLPGEDAQEKNKA